MQMRFSFVVSPFEGEKCSFSLSLSSFARDFPRDDGGGDDDLVRSVNRGNIERLIFFSSFLFLFIDDKMKACDKSIIRFCLIILCFMRRDEFGIKIFGK